MKRWTLALVLAAGCASGRSSHPDLDSAREHSYATRLLERRCQSCHRLPPLQRETKATWERGLARMQTLFHLPAADWDSLQTLVPADTTTRTE